MTWSEWHRAWRDMWHSKADALRRGWAEHEAQWEAETEPGYPLPKTARARRDLALAMADLFDAMP